MAGTRLFIHTTFVVEIFVLIIISFFYAATKNHGPFSSVEPFVVDQSGWKILVEDVSPVDKAGRGVVRRILDASQDVLLTLEHLFGSEKPMATRPETNVFVEEMKQKLSSLPIASFQYGDKIKQIPTLKIEVSMPQISNESKLQRLAESLQRGAQKHSPASVTVSAGHVDSTAASPSCAKWIPPNRRNSHHKVQLSQIFILTGCTSIHDSSKMLVEISRDEPIIILRTSHALENDDQWTELEQLLENDVSSILSNEILTTLPANERRMKSLSIELIDENPTTRSAAGADGRLQAKLEFEFLGQAFATAVKTLIQPLLSDLSLLYGGKIDVDHNYMPELQGMAAAGSIKLSTQVSAYLPLPDDMIEADEDNTVTTKYIFTDQMSTWVLANFNQNRRKSTASKSDSLHWALFVPSYAHTPLLVYDESSGEEGTSITFTFPTKGDEMKTVPLSGISLVNLDHLEYRGNDEEIDMDKMQQHFRNATSSALLYLVGYIRAVHGLSPMVNHEGSSTDDVSVTYLPQSEMARLSFWEMESITRNHWKFVLDKVLDETDALMSLLYTHSGLAFPKSVAHKLNNATNLLRHSVSLIERGYPTMYATSTLYGSLYYLESVQSDPELMELPHFAFDHYLAVFSPLILPLLMPMMAGLVREIKRYRNLRNKIADEVVFI